jgi:hypothetical protein
MGFEDFFKQKHKGHGYGYHDDHHNGHHHDHQQNHYDYRPDGYHRGYSYEGHHGNLILSHLLTKMKENRKIRNLVIAAGVIILLVVLVIIIALFPLIIKLINYLGQVGIQGIIDGIAGFIDKILKGSGK